MENKTAKITRTVFVSEWSNPQGGQVYYHEIELDNGDKGQIGSKEKMPSKLNPGSELTYTIEATTRGNKIKAVMAQGQFAGKGKAQVEPKIQFIGFAMRYSVDLVIAGKADRKELPALFEIVYGEMISKL